MELQGKITKSFMYTRVGQTLGYFVMIPENGNYQGETVGITITESTHESNKPESFQQGLEVSIQTEADPQLVNPEPTTWTADCKYAATAESCKILVHQ
jgi:hypothetical protein